MPLLNFNEAAKREYVAAVQAAAEGRAQRGAHGYKHAVKPVIEEHLNRYFGFLTTGKALYLYYQHGEVESGMNTRGFTDMAAILPDIDLTLANDVDMSLSGESQLRIWRSATAQRYSALAMMAPGREPTAHDDEYFNLWTPGEGVSHEELLARENYEEDFAVFEYHINHRVIRNKQHAKWMIQWFASVVQRPGHKIGSAVVVYGNKRTGKSALSELLRLAVGNKFFKRPSNGQHLFGKHATIIEDSLLVNINESSWKSDDGDDSFKRIITEDTFTIEPKNQAQRTVKNYANIFVDGNGSKNTKLVVPVSHDEEQRFFVAETTDDLREEKRNDTQSWRDFVRALTDNHGTSKEGMLNVLAGLMRVDLSDFKGTKPPRTEAFRKQMAKNLPITQEWMVDEFADFQVGEKAKYRLFDNELERAEVYGRFKRFVSELGRKIAIPKKDDLSDFLVEALGAVRKQTNRKGQPRKRVIVIPNVYRAAVRFHEKFDLWPFDDMEPEELRELVEGDKKESETGYSSESCESSSESEDSD